MIPALQKYWYSLSPIAKKKFALRAGSNIVSIRLTANGTRKQTTIDGQPLKACTAEFAARLETASDSEVFREDMSPTCRECPLACAGRAIWNVSEKYSIPTKTIIEALKKQGVIPE